MPGLLLLVGLGVLRRASKLCLPAAPRLFGQSRFRFQLRRPGPGRGRAHRPTHVLVALFLLLKEIPLGTTDLGRVLIEDDRGGSRDHFRGRGASSQRPRQGTGADSLLAALQPRGVATGACDSRFRGRRTSPKSPPVRERTSQGARRAAGAGKRRRSHGAGNCIRE